jgi:hypothetical protein
MYLRPRTPLKTNGDNDNKHDNDKRNTEENEDAIRCAGTSKRRYGIPTHGQRRTTNIPFLFVFYTLFL